MLAEYRKKVKWDAFVRKMTGGKGKLIGDSRDEKFFAPTVVPTMNQISCALFGIMKFFISPFAARGDKGSLIVRSDPIYKSRG